MGVCKEVCMLWSCDGPQLGAARKDTKAILIQQIYPMATLHMANDGL